MSFEQLIADVDIQITIPDLYPGGTPEYTTDGSCAIDLRASEPIILHRFGDKQRLSAGFKLRMPSGLAFVLIPRSGLGNNGVHLANVVGLIDFDYRGEVFVTIINSNRIDSVYVNRGDRIVQGMFVPAVRVAFNVVKDVGPNSHGGHGSTGVM